MIARDPLSEAHRQWTAHGWGDVADSMAVVTSVMRVQQLLLARMESALKPHGLTFARYEVLMLLSFTRTGALPLGKIGARLQVHPASVTNAIDRLQVDELVERVADPDDGRRTLARLTRLGRRRATAATKDVNAVFAELDLSRALFDDLLAVASRLTGA